MPEVVVCRYCDRCQAYREGAQVRLVGSGKATIAVCATCGCLGALNPIPGVRIIGRIPGPYFVTLAFLLVSLAIGAAIGYGARALAALPIPDAEAARRAAPGARPGALADAPRCFGLGVPESLGFH